MTFYLDTSVIVAWLTIEAASLRAIEWLEANASEPLAVSDWTITEVAAALSRKVRKGELDERELREAGASFDEALIDSFSILNVDRDCFREAARLASAYRIGLRGPDALHLAITRSSGCNLVTLDKDQAEAAAAFAISALLL